MEMATDDMPQIADEMANVQSPTDDEVNAPQQVKNLVKKIRDIIQADKRHHAKAFKRMRKDMFEAFHGHAPEYAPENYKANLAGRHVKQKTAALYAKNPKVSAKSVEKLDFTVWDEDPTSLQAAYQTVQAAPGLVAVAQAQIGAAPPDPMTGMAQSSPIVDAIQAGIEAAQSVIADYQQGTERRRQMQKFGKTLELLFAHALREQKPVDFKTGMKQMVRRTCTTGVGYLELGFQRQYGPRPGMTEKLADVRGRLDHLNRLLEDLADGDIDEDAAERAELEASLAALSAEPEIIVREGLIIDYPLSTRVIPDKLTTHLTGFIGARHLTLEYLFTPQEVQEMFDVDLGGKFQPYGADEKSDTAREATRVVEDGERDDPTSPTPENGMVCVWKHYDKPSGLVYYLADGHDTFLREPAAPDVFVEDFWPVYALTFNATENENELFPPSDVTLMRDQQAEYNRARQGLREHRQFARPRMAYSNGALEDADIEKLVQAKPFSATGLNLPQGASIADVLQPIQTPGVDPNLYETGQLFTDIQLTVGSSEAQFGGVAKATATESAIAANSSASSDSSSIDDLDAFLSVVARAGGQILMREMSPEQVTEIVGAGAVWLPMTLPDIVNEVYLEVEAGSTGKPNRAIEIQNWKELLPFLMQMPELSPMFLLKETLRRLDDRLDLTQAFAPQSPSIVSLNRMMQTGTGDPATDPAAQGAQGGDNAADQPAEQSGGTGPAFGSNQV